MVLSGDRHLREEEGKEEVKKEIDTWKLQGLFDAFKNALLWAWYLFGIIVGATLWFFPIPQSRLQTFAFAAIFVVYTLMSVAIAKVEQTRQELK